MRKSAWWKPTIGVMGAAAVLLLAGVSLAKPHDTAPGHSGDQHGHAGEHGHGGASGDDGGAGVSGRSGGGPGAHGAPHGGGAGACDPAAVAAVQAAVDATCPCAGRDDGLGGTTPWKNHGQYVRCVAHATRDQRHGAGLKHRCLAGTIPCAARSTCGKNGAVACVVTATGTCVGGACSTDAETSCTVDTDCDARTCEVTSADRCATAGGLAVAGSCCTASPSGAFLDLSSPF